MSDSEDALGSQDGHKGLGQSNAFEQLWTPHRRQYTSARDGSNRTFSELPLGSDEESLIVARGKHVYLVLNLYPYNPGHCMIVPYREVSEIEDLSSDEANELMWFTQQAVKMIKRIAHPHAFNIGFNLGKAAGGSISTHLHQHIVPRWIGDSSFISVIANVKIIPYLLSQTRDLYAQAWDAVIAENELR